MKINKYSRLYSRLKSAGFFGIISVFILILVVTAVSPAVYAEPTPLSDEQLQALKTWPNWVAYSCAPDTTDASPNGGATTSVDITDVVSKYHLQSATVQEVHGDTVASYHADEAPVTPASTMKLIIADTLLRNNIDLDTTITVSKDLYYDKGNDLGVGKITLADALEAMLSKSSNVGANVIMKALGGVDGFTKKAHAYGYDHTSVKGYYDPSNDGKNTSTISDEATAMNHIFSASASGYKAAQNALQKASKNDNHYGVVDDANEWAGTDDVAGNVGKLKVGSQDYIIGLYINKSSSDSSAISAVKNGTADLAKAIESDSSNDSSPTATDQSSSAACCPDPDGGDAGDAGGKDGVGGDSGSWSSGNKPPYILEEWAIEVLKDLAKKKGTSETDALTKEHVIALVAFAVGEGGDIQNSDLFNPLNSGLDAPELVEGGHSVSGVQSFKSFDAGVEAAARTFAKPQYSRLATALLKSSSTAKQFMYALSYNWQMSGGAIWAEASKAEPSYYHGRLSLVQQVKSNYKGTAGLVIGTAAHEQAENKTEPGKLQFDGSGGANDSSTSDSADTCVISSGSASSSGIAQEAINLSWPDASHGATPSPAYQKAYDQYNPHGPGLADCGGFVATVMHASKADPDYPPGGTAAQEQYVKSSKKYDVVDKVSDVSDLQPGDILIVNQGSGSGANGHTYIFVGNQPPHNFNAASASLGTRAANLGKAILSDNRGNYIRARLK